MGPTATLALLAVLAASRAHAEDPPPEARPRPSWSFEASAAAYFLPDDHNYVQPTLSADHGSLHLEARHNYEDKASTSFFAGWNLAVGDKVKLELTPMLGGVVGRTHGIIPALKLDLAWRRLELYSEGEYVFDLGDSDNSFLYNWSELSVWPLGWLRAGMVTQRTRVYQTARNLQRGVLAGLSSERIDGTVYLFNPGAGDQFWVASVAVRF